VDGYDEIHHLARPYIMAEILVDDGFMTALETALAENFVMPVQSKEEERKWCDMGTIMYLYENSSGGSRPRQAVIARMMDLVNTEDKVEKRGMFNDVRRFVKFADSEVKEAITSLNKFHEGWLR
jgi:hypothetical protein